MFSAQIDLLTDLSGFQPALLSAAARHARLILEIDTKI
jgi:hypothetical protein